VWALWVCLCEPSAWPLAAVPGRQQGRCRAPWHPVSFRNMLGVTVEAWQKLGSCLGHRTAAADLARRGKSAPRLSGGPGPPSRPTKQLSSPPSSSVGSRRRVPPSLATGPPLASARFQPQQRQKQDARPSSWPVSALAARSAHHSASFHPLCCTASRPAQTLPKRPGLAVHRLQEDRGAVEDRR